LNTIYLKPTIVFVSSLAHNSNNEHFKHILGALTKESCSDSKHHTIKIDAFP